LLYEQSLRGCPVDEDQICVLANYRDIQSRELIMVTRNRRAAREAALDSLLPAPVATYNPRSDPARSVASWFPARTETGSKSAMASSPATASSSHVNSPFYPSPRPMHSEAWLRDSSVKTTTATDIDLHSPVPHGKIADGNGADEEYRPNNSMMCFYSAKYLEDMRQLCSHCAGLMQSYTIEAGENGLSAARLVLNAREGTEASSCTDLVVLLHRQAAEGAGLFVLPMHTFVLKARCPVLYDLCLSQQQVPSVHMEETGSFGSTVAELRVVNAAGEVETKLVPIVDVGAAQTSGEFTVLTERAVPAELLYLLPLLVDFLYTGVKAIDALTLRYYCLQQMVRQDSEGRSLAELLHPLVDELLQAEIADFPNAGRTSHDKQDGSERYGQDYSEGDGAARVNRTSTMFMPIHDADTVELLLKVCVEDHCWRQSAALATRYINIAQQLMALARRLQLAQAVDALGSLLGRALCPHTAVRVYDTAVEFNCTQLVGIAARYLTAHCAILRAQLQRRPDLSALVTQMVASQSADVVSRADFRDMLAAASSRADKRRSGSALEALTKFLHSGSMDSDEDSDLYYSDEDDDVGGNVDDLWQLEEIPFLPAIVPPEAAPQQEINQEGSKGATGEEATTLAPLVLGRPAAVCLPRYISASVAPILQDTVIFLGGQNLDRLHPYRNRMLTYDCEENAFRFVSAGGSHIPKCGYMSCVSPLQKERPTHVLALGGKIKKAEISVHHTTLPQHLRTMRGTADSVWRKLEPHSALTGTPAASVTWGNLVGVSVGSAGPVSVVYNRLIDVWNLNADREELSQPTAEAYAAQVSAAVHSLNSTVDAEGNEIRFPKAQKLMKTMGLFYELDCETMTWRSPSVEIGALTQVSAFNAMSSALHGQQEAEVTAQRAALERRVAQAVAPLHPEDVSYRCCDCLFTAQPAVPCTCSTRADAVGDRVERSWVLQFGGYCDQQELITDDLHVLTCERRRLSADHAKASAPDDTSLQQAATYTPYTYKWARARPSGNVPAARFSHSMTTVPAQQELGRFLPLHAHTRVLIYGGVGYNIEGSELASLRINRGAQSLPPANYQECAHYAHWEEIQVSGAPPTPTGSHTMVHVPGTDLCVMHGGAYTGTQGDQHGQCCPHTHLLQLVDVRQGEDATTVLYVKWTRLVAGGIPPTLRSRHCSFAVTRRSDPAYAEIMIFGGVDEMRLARRQANNQQHDVSDLDVVVKDSVLHTLQLLQRQHPTRVFDPHWLHRDSGDPNFESRRSRLLYFRTEPSVQVPECSLTRDMLQLLDALFSAETVERCPDPERMQRIVAEFLAQRGDSVRSNASVAVPALEPQLTLDLINTDENATAVVTPFALHQSLLCTRCAWFGTLLTSNMKGGMAQQQDRMDDGSDHERVALYEVDPTAFRLLMVYVYADALMISSLGDVVAVLELANQFDLPSLALQCEGVLVRLTTLDNVCELLDYADTLNLTVLKAACTALLLRDVIGQGAKRGTDYASAMFADLPAPDGSTAETVMLDARDERSQLVAEFQALSSELRGEVLALYRQATQVYGATTASRSS
jgi:hypothetical protein